MTHIENIPHILSNGVTHANSQFSNQFYVSIGDKTIITTRRTKKIPDGRLLGDFIPFYFGVRSPMLYVVQNGFNSVPRTLAEDIVYLVSSVQNVLDCKIDFVFTDGHAVDDLTEFYYPPQIKEVDKIVDFHAAFAEFWSGTSDTDLKRKKEAEFLIFDNLPLNSIRGFVVYNEKAQERLLTLGIKKQKVVVKKNFYFST
jgi:hypothetical protein